MIEINISSDSLRQDSENSADNEATEIAKVKQHRKPTGRTRLVKAQIRRQAMQDNAKKESPIERSYQGKSEEKVDPIH